MHEGRDLGLQSKSDVRATLKWGVPYELRTKFRLGGACRGIHRVQGATYEEIYYKFSPGLI